MDTATDFKERFLECQEDIKSRKGSQDTSGVQVERAMLSPQKNDTEEEEEEEIEEFEEEEEYDDDYDNGETVMFHQQAFLRQKDDKTGKQIDGYLFDIKS